MTDSPLGKSRGRVLFSIRSTRIIPWLIVLAVLALFTFGLVLLVKAADIFVGNPIFPAKIRLNEFMDGDSELGFW